MFSESSFGEQIREDFPLLSQIVDENQCTETNQDIKYKGNFFCKQVPNFKNLSPIKQVKFGLVSADVFCGSNHTLVIKKSNLSPACITPEHSERLLSNGWFYTSPQERAIRPLVAILENDEDLGIKLTPMRVLSEQYYSTTQENFLNVTTLQGSLSGIPTVVEKITNVSGKNIVLNQVMDVGSIIRSDNSTFTVMYADAIGCSIEQWMEGFVICPYPTSLYDPIMLTSGESFVFYFSDDFSHNTGQINKITTSIWYEFENDKMQKNRAEIDYVLEREK